MFAHAHGAVCAARSESTLDTSTDLLFATCNALTAAASEAASAVVDAVLAYGAPGPLPPLCTRVDGCTHIYAVRDATGVSYRVMYAFIDTTWVRGALFALT